MKNYIIKDFDNTTNIQMDLASMCSNIIKTVIRDCTPEMEGYFKAINPGHYKIYINDKYCLIDADYKNNSAAFMIGTLEDVYLRAVAATISCSDYLDYNQIRNLFHENYFSDTHFVYWCPIRDNTITTDKVAAFLAAWLDDCAWPVVCDYNEKRVKRALKGSTYVQSDFFDKSVVVIETDIDNYPDTEMDAMKQGTAFYLENVGWITCHHVLTDHMCAYSPTDMYCKSYPVKIISCNETLDLAIIDIECFECDTPLIRGDSDKVQTMDNIIVGGFPNNRKGDSVRITPGVVTGFRPHHGIRKIMTNALIVSGNSGGPVIDSENTVIGVAVTGSDKAENMSETDDYGLIPINVIDFLKH